MTDRASLTAPAGVLAPGRPLRAVPPTPDQDPGPPAQPPVLRLVPAPICAPPYDDGCGTPVRLRLVRSPDAAPVCPPPHHGHVAHDGLRGHHGPPDEEPATGRLPDARPFAHAFVQRLLEVCGGVRPVPQLQRDTTPSLYADLERALVQRPRPTGSRPGGRDIRSVHVQQRPDGVAEVCATVRRGDRMAALALRLEGVKGRWLCTQVQGL